MAERGRGAVPAGWSRRVGRALILAGGLALALGGVDKAMDLERFRVAMGSHGVVPGGWLSVAAPGAALMELAVGFGAVWLVLVGRAGVAGWVLAGALSVLTGYTLVLWVDPPPAASPCGCLSGVSRVWGGDGLIDPGGWGWVAARNVAGVAAALWGVRACREGCTG